MDFFSAFTSKFKIFWNPEGTLKFIVSLGVPKIETL